MLMFGLPIETVAVLALTMIAGSLGMVHYLVVHKLLGKPFPEIDPEGES